MTTRIPRLFFVALWFAGSFAQQGRANVVPLTDERSITAAASGYVIVPTLDSRSDGPYTQTPSVPFGSFNQSVSANVFNNGASSSASQVSSISVQSPTTSFLASGSAAGHPCCYPNETFVSSVTSSSIYRFSFRLDADYDYLAAFDLFNQARWSGGAGGYGVEVGYRLLGASGEVFSVIERGNSGATHSSRSGSLSPGSYVFEVWVNESSYWYRGEGREAGGSYNGSLGLTLAQPVRDTLVSVGSPPGTFSQNKQNEPAVAIDAAHPNIVAAGANDDIDLEACNAGDPTTCPFTAGVGGSGIYFSFDSGHSWVQPTYTGFTARHCLGPAACTPQVGPIGTLPLYYENGLVSQGDPALAFGPKPDAKGNFAWANGSRLYYANLTENFPTTDTIRGPVAVAVSRTDDVRAAAAGNNNAWLPPVIVMRQSETTFTDKEQISADNAESSPFFGRVYVCAASFRSKSAGFAFPQPLVVAVSTDGGDTWQEKQVTPAATNPFNPLFGSGRSGCSVRTDSQGVVYVFANQFGIGTPGVGAHLLVKSFDGGRTWTRPTNLFTAVDTCFLIQNDGIGSRCVMDGIAGARDDLSSAPSVDIANGAPTGVGASNVIYETWVDGRGGVNHEHVFLSYSTNGGNTWSSPQSVERPGDRGLYSAVALSPDGTDAYIVYNAFTTPLRNDTSGPRGLRGVVLHSNVAANGAPAGFASLHEGIVGDPRGSSQNNQVLEFLGDYVYVAATNNFAVAVWNDVRNAADCPAIDAWRASVQAGSPIAHPRPQVDCPATFGNTDIFGGSFADPTR